MVIDKHRPTDIHTNIQLLDKLKGCKKPGTVPGSVHLVDLPIKLVYATPASTSTPSLYSCS